MTGSLMLKLVESSVDHSESSSHKLLSLEASDAVDFWRLACESTQAGERVRPRPGAVQQWRHMHALGLRAGFVALEDDEFHGTAWRNERTTDQAIVAWVEHHDFEKWRALFEVCFGHSVSHALWRWKYREAHKPGIGIWVAGELVAFYGGMPRIIRCEGREYPAIQVGDVMVHPQHRASLSRTGPFQMAASTFLEQQLSVGSPYWIGFGFPNRRAMQVARRLRLYRPVDEVVELQWPALASPHKQLPWWCNMRETRDMDRVAFAWARMQKSMPGNMLGVRDARYLRERYLQHPETGYRFIEVYHTVWRHVIGFVVAKVQTDDRLELLDLIGAPSDMAWMVLAARTWAHSLKLHSTYFWLTRSQLKHMQTTDPVVHEIGVLVPTNDWVPGNTHLKPDGRWWLTGGDTDFR